MSHDRPYLFRVEEVGREISLAWVMLEGSLSISNQNRLRETYRNIAEQGFKNVVLDFQNVDYIDSCAVSCLVVMFKEVSKRGGMLRICNPTMRVAKIFHFLGFDQTVQIISDDAQVRQSFLYQEDDSSKLWEKHGHS